MMRANIEQFGRTTISVGARPPFTYSVGNSLINLPELIVFGLRPEDATMLINEWSRAMMLQRREFSDGDLVTLAGGKFATKAVHCRPDARDLYTRQATNYLRHSDYRLVQMLVPDLAGKLPPDCAYPFNLQPILGIN